MGHANLSNIARFFVRRLYAKGRLSIAECIAALIAAGETLHASEGQYGDEDTIGMGVEQVVHSLCEISCWNWEDRPKTPFIQPLLTPWLGKRKDVSKPAAKLLDRCVKEPLDAGLHGVAGDCLDDEGHAAWAAYVRDLPAQRMAWQLCLDDNWDDADEAWETFDRIWWVFSPGWRAKYKEIPLLGNVTN